MEEFKAFDKLMEICSDEFFVFGELGKLNYVKEVTKGTVFRQEIRKVLIGVPALLFGAAVYRDDYVLMEYSSKPLLINKMG